MSRSISSYEELEDAIAEDKAAMRDRWGAVWEYDPERLTLTSKRPYPYEIDLESLKTSAQLCDMIFQVSSKNWAQSDHEIISTLVLALNDILRPQATLCSMGVEQGPIDVAEIARRTQGS